MLHTLNVYIYYIFIYHILVCDYISYVTSAMYYHIYIYQLHLNETGKMFRKFLRIINWVSILYYLSLTCNYQEALLFVSS